MKVTVMPSKYARSWPKRDKPLRTSDCAYVMEIGEALKRTYSKDAHFTGYCTPNRYRLNSDALNEGIAVHMTVIVFDVDGPDHVATEEWRRDIRQKVVKLSDVHPSPFYYETRGGSRIVYTQSTPTIIRTPEDAQRWSQDYAVAVAYLKRRVGIEADSACHDWQRLYRLPRATRDAGGKPENRPVWGNPDRIGSLLIKPERVDVETARAATKTFRNRSKPLDFSSPGAVDGGLLYWALRLRGDVGADAPRGGWICICPNRRQHTINTDGTDSTIIYPASAGKELGQIACLHGHCQEFGPKEWLRFFTDAELNAARERAGIVTRKKAA